jgi:hypothetical protein
MSLLPVAVGVNPRGWGHDPRLWGEEGADWAMPLLSVECRPQFSNQTDAAACRLPTFEVLLASDCLCKCHNLKTSTISPLTEFANCV